MTPIMDYHMHTPLCGHAVGEPEEYCRRAVEVGLDEIGFSDHAPLVAYFDPKVSMRLEQLSVYHKMIEEARRAFAGQLTVKLALEADYIEGYEAQSREIIDGYDYDYIIGSVHFIGDWAFDNPHETASWNGRDVDRVYRAYYELLRKSARTGLFQIIGHADLVKKFGHRPPSDMTAEIAATAEVFKDAGVAVEINTAGLRKPVKEMYPALAALKIYQAAGIPLTFGSDAHAPGEVGADFAAAADLARAAGYKEYVLFSKRRIERAAGL